MAVIQNLMGFLEILISPFESLFGIFPDLQNIITGLLVLSLGYFGWRAIK